MMHTKREHSALLSRSFFARDTLVVARELLGKTLMRDLDGQRLSGMVVETEAYLGQNDSANHASKGYTPRNSVMFGPPGIAYIYFIYGMHYMLNVVTEAEGSPCAVLIRAIEPLQGQHIMQRLRGNNHHNLSKGPARLCQALAIDKRFNRWDLTKGESLWFEDSQAIPDRLVVAGPRIGIGYAAPKDQQAPWRYWIKTTDRSLNAKTKKGEKK